MKNASLLLILLAFTSCKVLKLADDKNATNVKDIGIEANYGGKANNQYSKEIDASIENVITKFNSEHHAFKLHKKEKDDVAYYTLDFSKIKIVGPGGAAAGYFISALGLIATPIYAYTASEHSLFLAFYYFPANRVLYKGTLSPWLNKSPSLSHQFVAESGALFRNKVQRVAATKRNFEKQLYKTMLYLEKQVNKN